MKLSVAWIFDHIDANWKDVDIYELVNKFNQTTAEIESFEKVSFDLEKYTLAQVIAVEKEVIVLNTPEWKQEISIEKRDAPPIKNPGDWYLIKKTKKNIYCFATLANFHCSKEGYLVPVWVEKDLYSGRWKEFFEAEDYILDIDNKSITHRPDLWGHRGMAREIAAILNLPFKPLEEFIAQKPIKEYEKKAPSILAHPYGIKVENPILCPRFAGLYFDHIENRASLLWMAHRLARIDCRPFDTIVDTTNYVMFDISQPMHAFDADTIISKDVVVRLAKNKEKLTLLDDQQITLTSHDLVVTDGKKPIALAGIMGGKDSAVTAKTQSIFLESANFKANSVRKTSMQFKIRTDASARFEKSLDPNQNTVGILRYLKLLQEAQVPFHTCDQVISIGKRIEPITVRVSQNYIEERLGVSLAADFVIATLTKIGFTVEKDHTVFAIVVPTYRATKDVNIKVDIVEEIGRFYGFSNITPEFAWHQMKPFDNSVIFRLRKIKQFMAFTGQMHELSGYAFFDEKFIHKLDWKPQATIAVQNPVSENHYRLVTSLVPNLLKAVHENYIGYDQLRFFEWARIWNKEAKLEEKRSLAAIFYHQKNQVDFYQSKDLLTRFFSMLNIPISWEKVTKPSQAWFMPYQTSYIMHEGTKIGIAGKVHKGFLHTIAPGDAFICELDGDFLLDFKGKLPRFEILPKYQSVQRDVSMLITTQKTIDELCTRINSVDQKIKNSWLVDFFEKPEWEGQRSITIRFEIRHPEKTLTKDEVDQLYAKVIKELEKQGAKIR